MYYQLIKLMVTIPRGIWQSGRHVTKLLHPFRHFVSQNVTCYILFVDSSSHHQSTLHIVCGQQFPSPKHNKILETLLVYRQTCFTGPQHLNNNKTHNNLKQHSCTHTIQWYNKKSISLDYALAICFLWNLFLSKLHCQRNCPWSCQRNCPYQINFLFLLKLYNIVIRKKFLHKKYRVNWGEGGPSQLFTVLKYLEFLF